VPLAPLRGGRSGTDSATLRPRHTNRMVTGRELDRLAALPPDDTELLKQAVAGLGLSVALPHIAEAVQYRLLDRQA